MEERRAMIEPTILRRYSYMLETVRQRGEEIRGRGGTNLHIFYEQQITYVFLTYFRRNEIKVKLSVGRRK